MMYIMYIVKRTQIYLDEDQNSRLSKRAEAAGVTKSTLIRQALDEFLEGPLDEKARISRFLSAVDEIAKTPLDLPDGATYVEEIRARDIERQEELELRGR